MRIKYFLELTILGYALLPAAAFSNSDSCIDGLGSVGRVQPVPPAAKLPTEFPPKTPEDATRKLNAPAESTADRRSGDSVEIRSDQPPQGQRAILLEQKRQIEARLEEARTSFTTNGHSQEERNRLASIITRSTKALRALDAHLAQTPD